MASGYVEPVGGVGVLDPVGDTTTVDVIGSAGTSPIYVDDYLPLYATHSAAIQAAALAAETFPRGNVVFGNHSYTITDHDADGYGAIFKTARHSIEVQRGTRFDCSQMVAGQTAVLWLGGTNNDWGDTNSFGHAVAEIQLPRIQGPITNVATATTGPIGMEIAGATSTTAAARMTFRGGAISGFYNGVVEHSNAYAWQFIGTEIYNNVIGYLGPTNDTDTNADESNVFIGCTIYGNCIDIHTRNFYGDTYLTNCRLDYGGLKSGVSRGDPANPASCKLWAERGTIVATGVHFEDVGSMDRWWIAGRDGAVVLNSPHIHLGGNAIASDLELGYSTAGSWGGITLRDPTIRMRLVYPFTKLIAGPGKVRGDNVMHVNGAPVGEASHFPAISDSLNLLDGTFETADALSRWDFTYTVGASSAPTIDATTAHSGAKSLKFSVPDASGRSQVTLWLKVQPGEILHLAFFLKLLGLTGAERFSLGFQAFDGQPLAGASHLIETVTKTWGPADQVFTIWQNPPYVVPAQAAWVTVSLYSEFWGATPRAWVDELVLNPS